MAQVDISETKVNLMVRRMLQERARLALEIYTLKELEYDKPSHPWERRKDQRSIRSPKSQSVTPLGAAGVRIAVTAVGATFIEDGNQPDGGGLIRKKPRSKGLVLPLKGGGFAIRSHVRPYKGTDRLWNSVKEAFKFAV
jgi:hypothetical protein